jgi:type II secretory pathway component GspD/PulD (secretin)
MQHTTRTGWRLGAVALGLFLGLGSIDAAAQQPSKPATKPQIVDPQSNKAKTGTRNAPITITVVGNRLIVQSDDPEALATATELARMLKRSPASGSFEVIPLHNASAADAAKILDEAFNDVKPQNQLNQQNPFFRRFNPVMFQQQQQQPKPKEPRVRIVADTGSNSLLVKANPIDMAEIKRIIRESIDRGTPNPTLKTYKIGPLKYADASDIEDTIKDIYHEQMDQNPDLSQVRGGRRTMMAAFAPNRNVDASGNPRPVNLTLSVDYRTNSLILHTTSALYKDIKALALDLDRSADKSDQEVMFIPLKDLDPVLAKEAVDTLMGRPRTNNQQQQPFGGFRGGFGGGGRGFGGFGGGGRGFGGFGGGGRGYGGFGGPGGGGRGFGGGGRGQ